MRTLLERILILDWTIWETYTDVWCSLRKDTPLLVLTAGHSQRRNHTCTWTVTRLRFTATLLLRRKRLWPCEAATIRIQYYLLLTLWLIRRPRIRNFRFRLSRFTEIAVRNFNPMSNLRIIHTIYLMSFLQFISANQKILTVSYKSLQITSELSIGKISLHRARKLFFSLERYKNGCMSFEAVTENPEDFQHPLIHRNVRLRAGEHVVSNFHSELICCCFRISSNFICHYYDNLKSPGPKYFREIAINSLDAITKLSFWQCCHYYRRHHSYFTVHLAMAVSRVESGFASLLSSHSKECFKCTQPTAGPMWRCRCTRFFRRPCFIMTTHEMHSVLHCSAWVFINRAIDGRSMQLCTNMTSC